MTAETITSTIDGPIATVRIERPESMNAFTYPMIGAIRDAVDAAAADPAVGAIVITGLGRAFSAGLDMTTLGSTAGGQRDTRQTPPTELPALFGFLLDVPKPIVAAVNGVAAGGGMVLAMMCDLRFAADTASFTTAFSKRGLIAEHGTAWLLPRLVGTSRALDLLWSARRIGAEEAYRTGFVDRIVPGDQLLDETNRYLTELLSTVAPRSIATIKRQVYAGWSQTFAESTIEMSRVLTASLDHPDLKEGVASFVERRPPQFAPVGPEDRHPSPSTQVHSDNDLLGGQR
ncbi:MAG: enoyl-CoA hydratase-related protein [Ilumatobacteraceae bacterium]